MWPAQLKAMELSHPRYSSTERTSHSAKKRRLVSESPAKNLYETLSQGLIDPRILYGDWYQELSDKQFDMLLSIRLYTGPLYRYMVMVPNEEYSVWDYNDNDEPVFVRYKLPEIPKSKTDFGPSVAFALANALRRKRCSDTEENDLVREMKEMYPRVFGDELDEKEFRKEVYMLLVAADRRPSFVDLENHLESKFDPRFDQEQKNVRFFWSAMECVANDLETLVTEADNVTGRLDTLVYRGLTEEPDHERLTHSFSSVSTSEQVARQYTSNPTLESEENGDADSTCCILRIVLKPGTPYLDTTVLSRSGGWGFGLADREYILPPGLTWQYIEASHNLARLFPREIDESVWYHDGFEVDTSDKPSDADDDWEFDPRNFRTSYYVVSGPVAKNW